MSYSIVVLISGNGSVLQSIIDAKIPIAAVISNRAEAFGLQRAQRAQIPTHVLSPQDFADRTQYDEALSKIIDRYHPQLIVLAGFMRILTPHFVQQYLGKLINIHPSLLPHYRGTNTYTRVLAASEQYHGTSVHFVTEELDSGPLIAQVYFPVTPHATVESLQKQVHEIEHFLYPRVIRWFLENKVRLNINDVEWLDAELARKTTHNFMRFSCKECKEDVKLFKKM